MVSGATWIQGRRVEGVGAVAQHSPEVEAVAAHSRDTAKTADMVGREKELTIHFVPGDCRVVEVKESSRGLGGIGVQRIGFPGASR